MPQTVKEAIYLKGREGWRRLSAPKPSSGGVPNDHAQDFRGLE